MKEAKTTSKPGKKLVIVIGSMVLFCVLQISFNALAQSTAPSSNSNAFWVWRWMGRWHPMVIHFPVALILLATLLEFFTLKKLIRVGVL